MCWLGKNEQIFTGFCKAVFLPVSIYKAILFICMIGEMPSYLKYLCSIYIKSSRSVVSFYRSLDMFTNRKKCNSIVKKKLDASHMHCARKEASKIWFE